MRQIIYLIFLNLFISCSSTDNSYDEIEFVSYNWRFHKSDSTHPFGDYYVSWHMYALIDNNENCNLIVKWSYPKDSIRFFSFKADRILIDSITNTFNKIKPDTLVRKKWDTLNVHIYDGPSLKIRINKNKIQNTYSFKDSNDESDRLNFIKFYHYIDSLVESGIIDTIIYNQNLISRRDKFIDYIVKSDTMMLPFPPPPPGKQIIFKPRFKPTKNK